MLALKDADKQEVEAILGQLAHFKPIDISNNDSSRAKNSICYSINKSVSAEKIAQAVETYDSRLEEQSKVIQQQLAVATSNQTKEILSKAGADVKNTGIEFEEVMAVTSNSEGKKQKIEVNR